VIRFFLKYYLFSSFKLFGLFYCYSRYVTASQLCVQDRLSGRDFAIRSQVLARHGMVATNSRRHPALPPYGSRISQFLPWKPSLTARFWTVCYIKIDRFSTGL